MNGRGFVTNSTDQDASNGVVHLIDGFLLYDTYSSGGLIERYPYYSELQDALAKVNLFDILTGNYDDFFLSIIHLDLPFTLSGVSRIFLVAPTLKVGVLIYFLPKTA